MARSHTSTHTNTVSNKSQCSPCKRGTNTHIVAVNPNFTVFVFLYVNINRDGILKKTESKRMYLETCNIRRINKIRMSAPRAVKKKEKKHQKIYFCLHILCNNFQMDAMEKHTQVPHTDAGTHTQTYFHQPPHFEIIIHSDAISLWIKGSNMSPKPNCNISAVYKDRREGERARGSNWGKQIPTRFCLLSPCLSFLSVSHPPTPLLSVLRHHFQQ